MKEFTKKEVVELIWEFDRGNLNPNNFLKEKGLIEPELEVGWLARDWNNGDVDVFLCTENTGDRYTYHPECYFRNGNNIPSINSNVGKFDPRYTTRKATDEEVSDALTKEGQKYIGKTILTKGGVKKFIKGRVTYSDGIVYGVCDNNFYRELFRDGKWAEIIEDVNDINVADIGNEINVNGITYVKKLESTLKELL